MGTESAQFKQTTLWDWAEQALTPQRSLAGIANPVTVRFVPYGTLLDVSLDTPEVSYINYQHSSTFWATALRLTRLLRSWSFGDDFEAVDLTGRTQVVGTIRRHDALCVTHAPGLYPRQVGVYRNSECNFMALPAERLSEATRLFVTLREGDRSAPLLPAVDFHQDRPGHGDKWWVELEDGQRHPPYLLTQLVVIRF